MLVWTWPFALRLAGLECWCGMLLSRLRCRRWCEVVFEGSSDPVTGVGQAGGRGCSGSTFGASVMQCPGCVGEQIKWSWFCCAGLLWFAGFAFIFQQSGFWQSTCEKCTGPSDWVAAGSAHTILSSRLCCGHEKTPLHQCKTLFVP